MAYPDNSGMLVTGGPCEPGRTVPDDVLVAEFRAGGNQEPFEELRRRHRKAVWQCAMNILHDTGRAEDSEQETFKRAFQSLDSYRGSGSFRSWLLRIAHNEALNQRRKLGQEEMVSDDMLAAVPATPEPDHDLVTRVVECIGLIPNADQRIALKLRHIDGYTYDEIARRMAIPDATSHIQNARRMFKKIWTERFGANGEIR